jgi:hypothetical protein
MLDITLPTNFLPKQKQRTELITDMDGFEVFAWVVCMSESASRPLVDFGVLNDNLIKRLISCVK